MESVRDLFVELFGECVNIMLRRWQEAISFQESRFYIKNFQDMMLGGALYHLTKNDDKHS